MSRFFHDASFTFTRVVASAIVCVALLVTTAVANQTTFDNADWFERQIGDGVVWRQYEFDNLFGVRQHISYVEIDLDNPAVSVEIPYLMGTQRTSLMIPNQFPTAITGVNGTYFASGGHNTYLRINGTEIPYQPRTKGTWGHHAALAQNASDDWEVIAMPATASQWDDNVTHPEIIANGPWLVKNGVIDNASIALPSGTHCTGRHPRTAVGITNDNKLILLVVDGRTDRSTGTTCVETAQILLWLDVENAVNMDGGGSTTHYVKDEPASGVVNYVSDGTGERPCANAIAIISTPAAPAAWDGQLLSVTYSEIMLPEASQNVTITYRNIGTETWTAADTKLITSRPAERNSDLYEAAWVSPSQPALMSPATVAPGNNATFTFPVTAPDTSNFILYVEHFMLTQESVGRIGPSDSRARLKIAVVPETPPGDSFIVETRLGGQNYSWYDNEDPTGVFADSTVNCTAPGTTSGIGSRWTSSHTAIVGVRTAQYRPNFPQSGEYHVSVAWPDGSSRRDPIVYHVDHDGGRDTFHINQDTAPNTWYPLGTFNFTAGQSDDGRVIISNEDTFQSGNMWAGPVRFVRIIPTSVEDWELY